MKYTFDDHAYPVMFEAAWGFPPSSGNITWYKLLPNVDEKQNIWLDLCRRAGYQTTEVLNHESEEFCNACEDDD